MINECWSNWVLIDNISLFLLWIILFLLCTLININPTIVRLYILRMSFSTPYLVNPTSDTNCEADRWAALPSKEAEAKRPKYNPVWAFIKIIDTWLTASILLFSLNTSCSHKDLTHTQTGNTEPKYPHSNQTNKTQVRGEETTQGTRCTQSAVTDMGEGEHFSE